MLQNYIDKLNSLNFADMYESDFFLTWGKDRRRDRRGVRGGRRPAESAGAQPLHENF